MCSFKIQLQHILSPLPTFVNSMHLCYFKFQYIGKFPMHFSKSMCHVSSNLYDILLWFTTKEICWLKLHKNLTFQ